MKIPKKATPVWPKWMAGIVIVLTTIAGLLFTLSPFDKNLLFVGGGFSFYEGSNSFRGMIISPDGAKKTDFDVGNGFEFGKPFSAAWDSKNERIFVGGDFDGYDEMSAGRIVVLDEFGNNVSGAGFQSGSGFDAAVYAVARDPQAEDSFFVGGEFTEYNGKPAPGIIKLKGNGEIDKAFAPGTGIEYSTSPNPARIVTIAFYKKTNQVCFGGSFTSFDNLPANNFICVSAITPIFAKPMTDAQKALFAIMAGSGFTHVPATTSYEGEVDRIVIDETEDKFYVGGRFNRYDGTVETNSLVRLNSNGGFDVNYEIEHQAFLRVPFILAEPNAVIAGGKSYQGQPYNSLVKFDRDTGDLVPGFAVTEGSVPGKIEGLGIYTLVDGESISAGKLYFAGHDTEISGDKTIAYYNLEQHSPLLRIDKTTGEIDQDFMFAEDFSTLIPDGPANATVLLVIP